MDILDAIGSTEAGHMYIANRPGDVTAGSSGGVVAGYAVRVVDDDGHDVPPGTPGRLLLSGDSLAKYYWHNPKPVLEDGWFDTGDTYRENPDGTYAYSGRSGDMLKVGGIWCSPAEIEAALIEHPDVLEAAVIGREDADGLVKPEAWIVPKVPVEEVPEALDADLVRHCRTRLAPYKFPRWVQVVPDLPKTATGKIQRFRPAPAAHGRDTGMRAMSTMHGVMPPSWPGHLRATVEADGRPASRPAMTVRQRPLLPRGDAGSRWPCRCVRAMASQTAGGGHRNNRARPAMKSILTLTVNGRRREDLVPDTMLLLDYLREQLGLTGTKQGCDGGECGACTVLVDDQPRLACSTLAVQMQGRRVETIEGLAKGGRLSRLQQAFHEKLGTQCGFCTPGMIMAAEALLRRNPNPTATRSRRRWPAICAAAPAT